MLPCFRPATAPQHTRPPAQKQQSAEAAHPILQYLSFQDAQGACLPAALWAVASSQHPQASARNSCGASHATRPARSSALPPYRPTAAGSTQATLQQQQLSSTLLAHVAAAAAAAGAGAAVPPCPAAWAGPAPAACSSRPVTPHATKPHRSMPALSTLLQHASLTTSSCSRPTTAAGRLLHPHGASSSNSRTGQLLARPATASSSSYGLVTDRDSWQSAGPGSTEALQLRPGSAAAAKILRAMDKACVATPSTAAARAAGCRPGGACCSAQRAGAEVQSVQPAVKQVPQAQQQHNCAPYTVPRASSSQHSSVQSLAAADDPGPGSLMADTQTDQNFSSSRPTTAAVQSILSAAAAAEDGVKARLAAIREKNSRNDNSAGLDIVNEEDPVVEETPCEGQGAASRVVDGLTVVYAAEVAALGGQAGAMVLNLEDFSMCTPEVLEIELESLDVEQLMQLKQLL